MPGKPSQLCARLDPRSIGRAILGAAAMSLTLSSPAKAAEFEAAMSDLRWQARVLLVFSPGADDSRAQAFFDASAQAACELEERDLVIGHIVADGRSHVGDVTLAANAADDARSKYHIDPADSRVLLIGKDGGRKAGYTAVPALDEVFALIDGMPMRRREARVQTETCRK